MHGSEATTKQAEVREWKTPPQRDAPTMKLATRLRKRLAVDKAHWGKICGCVGPGLGDQSVAHGEPPHPTLGVPLAFRTGGERGSEPVQEVTWRSP